MIYEAYCSIPNWVLNIAVNWTENEDFKNFKRRQFTSPVSLFVSDKLVSLCILFRWPENGDEEDATPMSSIEIGSLRGIFDFVPNL